MEGEVGAQVAPPMLLHHPLSGRFREVPPLARKRDFAWQNPNIYHHEQQQRFLGSATHGNPGADWNSKMWAWDSTMFTAKPLSDAADGVLCLGSQRRVAAAPAPATAAGLEQRKEGNVSNANGLATASAARKVPSEDGEELTLKLGGGSFPAPEEQALRPAKRVRSGSPGSVGNYPMCQVDDCKADLSNAKDYHRRHKVCEVHSKTTKALVGKQMQRFCQQCSRFHPLSEFDEGKRSCRRRLAGHNRRRRKTQPEDASSRLLLPGSRENNGNGNLDIVNLISILARLQENGVDKATNSSTLPDKDRLMHIISKINSMPNTNTTTKLPSNGGFDLNVPQTAQPSDSLPKANGSLPKANGGPSAPPTKNLLAVLSSALNVSGPDTITALSQWSCDNTDGDKAKTNYNEPTADVNSRNRPNAAVSPNEIMRDSNVLQSSLEASNHIVHEPRSNIPLQLFSSTEDESPPKVRSFRKYLSSESSNPMEEMSPSSSPPVVRKFFPLHSSPPENIGCGDDTANVEASTSQRWISHFGLEKSSERGLGNQLVRNLPYHAGYTSSSSGSDHSPSSSNSDAHDQTGRIIFKLFDKNPNDLPGTLRTQILNWLSHIPSEMESYIRPGCVVLSVYLSMPSIAWDELQEDLFQRMHLLVQSADSDFWRSGRFLVHTDRQLASHKDGRIRMCKTWKTWSSPELMSVSPLAVVSGKETPLLLRGRNLSVPGTKIHCTYMGGYTSKVILGSTYQGTVYDDSILEIFNFPGGPPNTIGRFFVEVENGFKGNNFPVIVASDGICQELRVLESELEVVSSSDTILDDQGHESGSPKSREEILHFLNELGWLFQRRNSPSSLSLKDFSCLRFKFLLTFAVGRDWSLLVRELLDLLVERSSGSNDLIQESLEAVSDIQLLSQAVKRKCRTMVDLLLNYYVIGGSNTSKVYIFAPNAVGPGGLTPLHLAASTQESEVMVDALTNDPQELGLKCWNTSVDDSGQSPYEYAAMRNNHSYNRLVERKLSDRKNCQVSITVENEKSLLDKSWTVGALPLRTSCARCAAVEGIRLGGTIRSQGLLRRPYIHSMLAIAAVCVCVCLFLRGAPQLGMVAPFKWENLDYGPR